MGAAYNRPMQPDWIDSATAWISAHPNAAGALIFLIALCDAIIVVGIVVPALPLLFAVGAMIGLGHINGPYAVACAAAGAFVGDGLSYWIGRRFGPQLRQRWPFSRYPQWIDRGEQLFRRHGTKSILIARFVGAVRPFVPAIAGMLRVPAPRYFVPSLVACMSWAAAFLAPGWLLGASYEAVAAVADRLALALGALLVAVAAVWASVLYTWRWFAQRADALLVRALRWTREHPRLGRYAAPLIDPNRPESPSLLILALCLIGIGWLWFTLLATVLAKGGPLGFDRSVHETMASLRNPLADRLMAALASLGDPPTLGIAALSALVFLAWRRRWIAAAHWIAALAFGLVLTAVLGAAIDMPRPPHAPADFGFPSVAVTMTTITFGFFAVLIARELPGRRRVWPYLLAGVVTTLLGFARLYLGAHWISELLGGTLFGIVWLLVLGIAYRRHVARSFWMRPLALAFYGSFVVAAVWYLPTASTRMLQRLAVAAPAHVLDAQAWWERDWTELPAQRDERQARGRWPLNVQVAGPLGPLRERLKAAGWRVQPQADWLDTVRLLDDDRAPADQAVLPATLDSHAEVLLLLRPGAGPHEQYALRLWRAPAALDDGTPLWIGTAQTLRLVKPFDAVTIWRPEPDAGAAYAALRDAVGAAAAIAEAPHPVTRTPVLRLRTDAGPSGTR